MYVYILYSKSINSFYTGSSNEPDKRLNDHNSGYSKYTAKGAPWKLVHTIKCNDRSEAVNLETKVKKRGAKRFLIDNNIDVSGKAHHAMGVRVAGFPMKSGPHRQNNKVRLGTSSHGREGCSFLIESEPHRQNLKLSSK